MIIKVIQHVNTSHVNMINKSIYLCTVLIPFIAHFLYINNPLTCVPKTSISALPDYRN